MPGTRMSSQPGMREAAALSASISRPGLTEGEAWPELDGVLSGKTITGERHLFEACAIPCVSNFAR
jgi:hypothetical protein